MILLGFHSLFLQHFLCDLWLNLQQPMTLFRFPDVPVYRPAHAHDVTERLYTAGLRCRACLTHRTIKLLKVLGLGLHIRNYFLGRRVYINEWTPLVLPQRSVFPVKLWIRICSSRLKPLNRPRSRTGVNQSTLRRSSRRWWWTQRREDRTVKESFWERYQSVFQCLELIGAGHFN